MHIVSLPEMSGATQQQLAPLRVRVRGGAANTKGICSESTLKQLPARPLLEEALQEYKKAAAQSDGPEAAREQHVWNLVGASLAAVLKSPNPNTPMDEAISLLSAQQREALLGWLRLAMADRAEQNLEGDAGLSKIWKLATALQTESAIECALEGHGSNAYLATLLAQPVKSVHEDMQKQASAWQEGSRNGGSDVELVPSELQRLVALLSGEMPPLDDEDWKPAYALALGFAASPRRVPSASATSNGRSDAPTPRDPAWHLLRLRFEPQRELRPLPPRQALQQSGNWVQLRDYSLSWHLRLVVGELLGLKRPSRHERLHRAYCEQLEMSGSWHALAYACTSLPEDAETEAALLSQMLSRSPPPDEISAQLARLLDTDAWTAPVPLTPNAAELHSEWLDSHPCDPHRLEALLHAAQAERALYSRRPAALLRHYLRAAKAAREAGPSAGLPSLDWLWLKAHRALVDELLPAQIIRAGSRPLDADAKKVLEALRDEASRSDKLTGWADGGRNALEYTCCIEQYFQCLANFTGRDRDLEQLCDTVELLLKRVREESVTSESKLEEEASKLGKWLAETVDQVMAREEMEKQLTRMVTDIKSVRHGIAMDEQMNVDA